MVTLDFASGSKTTIMDDAKIIPIVRGGTNMSVAASTIQDGDTVCIVMGLPFVEVDTVTVT